MAVGPKELRSRLGWGGLWSVEVGGLASQLQWLSAWGLFRARCLRQREELCFGHKEARSMGVVVKLDRSLGYEGKGNGSIMSRGREWLDGAV